eukprot:scaffold9715_cov113-Isochrysis_galbana.AAC.3
MGRRTRRPPPPTRQYTAGGGASWRGSIFDPLRTETGPHPTRGGALFQTLTTGRNGGEFAAHTRILMPLRAAAPPGCPALLLQS